MDTTLRDTLVGRLLEDRYLVLERIDRGGMATVYHALDRRLGRDVALKVLHPHLAGDEAFTARFDREARSAARLSHPDVVAVYDQGRDGELAFLAMEYLPGRTLRQVLAERGALTPREMLRVMEPVLAGLAAAHRAGLVHRDVKPENVILTDDGRVKVADFGLARAATATATSNVLLGTVAYLAPETVLHGSADARSDVYAAGVVMFELLTGRQPFVGEVAAQVAYQHVHQDVPAPSAVVPALPAALDEVVLAATARNPDERPVDADALLVVLRAARARLTGQDLDVRADVPPTAVAAPTPSPPGPEQAGPAAVADGTEVFAPQVQRTQVLPGLAATPTAAAGGRRRLVPSALPVNEPDAPRRDRGFTRLAEQRRRRGLVLAGLVVAALVLLVVGAYWFLAGPGARVQVPPTGTLTQAEGVRALEAAGFTVEVVTKQSDTVAKGVVIGTEPGAGRSAPKGGTVRLLVSSGPTRVPVPAVAGLTVDEATALLQREGLKVGRTVEEYSGTVEAGQVLRSEPAEGTERPRGSRVTLVVSNGQEPLQVPDVRNRPQAEAEQLITQNGLVAAVSPEQEGSATVPAGAVVSQSPAPGERLAPGGIVTIVISSGPQLVRVPSVIGKRVEDAIKELEERGFRVVVNGDTSGNPDRLRVYLQNPLPFTEQPQGTQVTLEAGQGFR